MTTFDYSRDFKNIDFRSSPEMYKVGKGEQGVLLVEPYKSEILPYWRFKTPEVAKESSKKIYQLFLDYLEKADFIGTDMARKFLQMGYTRSRRYANHKSNPQKVSTESEEKMLRKQILPNQEDQIKAQSAEIFRKKWLEAKTNPKYLELKLKHQLMYERN